VRNGVPGIFGFWAPNCKDNLQFPLLDALYGSHDSDDMGSRRNPVVIYVFGLSFFWHYTVLNTINQ
jgi:hypothetical protein